MGRSGGSREREDGEGLAVYPRVRWRARGVDGDCIVQSLRRVAAGTVLVVLDAGAGKRKRRGWCLCWWVGF